MATTHSDRRAFRCRILADWGASGAIISELLEYNERPFHRDVGAGAAALPLLDEPHVRPWTEYEAHAREVGVFEALRERFFQLQFPIREGISGDEAYRRATLRGLAPSALELPSPLTLNRPRDLQLVLNPTLAGRIPLLIVPDRADFETLVRAFTERNEPVPVPDSMGACIVGGFNNWDRIARHRERWQQDSEGQEAGTWADELRRIVLRKELYQDRFIILSTGPYSFVPASAVGLTDEEWRWKSLVIRREHECMHYVTRRVLGSMKNNLQDEIIADFVGLLYAFGSYAGDLALRFFGLEDYPAYRPGGRLEIYLGPPPLSSGAAAVVRTLVLQAVRNLEAFARANPQRLRGSSGITRVALALAELTLEELASSDLPHLMEERPAGATLPVRQEAPGDSLWIDLGADESMARLLAEFDRFAGAHPRLAAVHADMSLALDELVSNVLHHGYNHEECEDGHEHVILVGVNVHREHLEIEIIDDAMCFSPLDAPDPDLERALADRPIGGLGIHLVRSLMDGMEYRRYAGRNHLLMRKRLSPA